MPYSDADFAPLQEAAGHGTGTSVAVTLPGTTTAGTTVIIFLYIPSSTVTSTGIPAGFSSNSNNNYIRSDVAAGEGPTWTFTLSISTSWAYHVMEDDNIALADPYDLTAATTGTTANGATRSTGTTVNTAGSESVAFAYYAANKAGAGDVQSWGSWTNGYIEQVDSAPAGTGSQIAVARKYISNFATTETTATFATTAAAPTTLARVVVYRAAGASINAPLSYATGFEFGTHAGGANIPSGTDAGPAAGANLTGTYGTTYLVQPGSARNGNYGLRLAPSAGAASLDTSQRYAAASRITTGFNIRPQSATGQATMALIVGSASNLELVYDSSTNKFGLGWVGFTTVWQTGTTPLNTWAWVDIRVFTNAYTHHADWTIETGDGDGTQTSPADLTGMILGTSSYVLLGNSATETYSADYDDLVVTRHAGAYPLGQHAVTVLVPETTGASVSGTAGNFNQFTNNGTLAAFASTNGALLDEVPPTVGASSDGVVQVTLAASDYMNFPMTTYTLASDEIIAAVRAMAALWGGTGTGTGTLGFRGHDGTTETTFVAASTSFDPDSLTTASATYPLWYSAMWPNSWTQTKLNAAALRLGFSTDATPDMGASAMYLEVATRKAVTARQITLEDPMSATVDVLVGPYESASVSYVITNSDATRSVNFNYSISGTPQTPVTVGPSSNQTIDIHADSFGDISDVSLEPQ